MSFVGAVVAPQFVPAVAYAPTLANYTCLATCFQPKIISEKITLRPNCITWAKKWMERKGKTRGFPLFRVGKRMPSFNSNRGQTAATDRHGDPAVANGQFPARFFNQVAGVGFFGRYTSIELEVGGGRAAFGFP